jgi:hypothetical protein
VLVFSVSKKREEEKLGPGPSLLRATQAAPKIGAIQRKKRREG